MLKKTKKGAARKDEAAGRRKMSPGGAVKTKRVEVPPSRTRRTEPVKEESRAAIGTRAASGSAGTKKDAGARKTAGPRVSWQGGNMLYPLPAVMVSCKGADGKDNILTVAWAGTICTNPPMVSISIRPQRYSYQLIRESGEFVINLTTGTLAKAADFCGVRSGRDTDKFAQMNLTAGKCTKVAAPLIEESPVNLECRVRQVLELGSHHMFIADVLAVDVDEQYLDANGRLDLAKADLIVYSHGEYFTLGERLGTFGYSVRKKTGRTAGW